MFDMTLYSGIGGLFLPEQASRCLFWKKYASEVWGNYVQTVAIR